MKAITLYQPYATLCCLGLKVDETRSWPTTYRGPLAIHAARTEPRSCYNAYLEKKLWWPILGSEIPAGQSFGVIEMLLGWKFLPRGGVIGTVELVGCVATDKRRREIGSFQMMVVEHKRRKTMTIKQRDLGDYANGRWAWLFENPVLLDKMVAAKGQPRIWNLDDCLVARMTGWQEPEESRT